MSRKALAQRPEILQGIEAIRAAGIRQKVTRNELLPAVNLLLEGYVAGLQSDYNFPGAWSNQFNQGGPGFLVGVSIEFPWENNGAKARHTRSSLELRQQFNQFQTTIDTVLLEVKVSARDIDTSWRDYAAKLEAATAGRADLDQLTSRREIDIAPLPGSPEETSQTGSEYLDRLLDSQSRFSSRKCNWPNQSSSTRSPSWDWRGRRAIFFRERISRSFAERTKTGFHSRTAKAW